MPSGRHSSHYIFYRCFHISHRIVVACCNSSQSMQSERISKTVNMLTLCLGVGTQQASLLVADLNLAVSYNSKTFGSAVAPRLEGKALSEKHIAELVQNPFAGVLQCHGRSLLSRPKASVSLC